MQVQHHSQFGTEIASRARKGSVSDAINSPMLAARAMSTVQPVGAQGKLIDAAVISNRMGHAINRLLTVRTEALENATATNRFNRSTLAQDVEAFLDLLRKWITARQMPCAFIWSREIGKARTEHLHLGFHLQSRFDALFADQCVRWFGEDKSPKLKAKKVLAESQHGVWQIKASERGNSSGTRIAIYLGKDEPDTLSSAWRKLKPNLQKRCPVHPVTPGLIVGLGRNIYRHGTSRNISPTSAAGKAILMLASNAERLISDHSQLPY